MEIAKLIANTLAAMGAKPETMVNSTGETIIKINAPIAGGNGGTDEKTKD